MIIRVEILFPNMILEIEFNTYYMYQAIVQNYMPLDNYMGILNKILLPLNNDF